MRFYQYYMNLKCHNINKWKNYHSNYDIPVFDSQPAKVVPATAKVIRVWAIIVINKIKDKLDLKSMLIKETNRRPLYTTAKHTKLA